MHSPCDTRQVQQLRCWYNKITILILIIIIIIIIIIILILIIIPKIKI